MDFLARMPDGASELIQVAADYSDAATAQRELRALEEAQGNLAKRDPQVVDVNPTRPSR